MKGPIKMQTQNYLLVTTKDGTVIGKLRERDGISDCLPKSRTTTAP